MKFLSSILLLILSFNAFGQINIFIEDETNSSFLIGIDGFAQNKEAKTKILIKNLDTSSHLLQLKLEDKPFQHFSRNLKLSNKGNYKYVIVKNFKGTPQLRYRGKLSQIPANVTSVVFNKESEWEYGTSPIDSVVSQIDSTIVAVTDTLTIVSKQDSAVVAVIKDTIPPTTVTDTIKVPPVDTTVVPIVSPDSSSTVTSTDTIDHFQKLLLDMGEAEFEFNRLNLAKNYLLSNSISVEEIAEVFKVFNYDNTRMQFLSFAIARLVDKDKLGELESSF